MISSAEVRQAPTQLRSPRATSSCAECKARASRRGRRAVLRRAGPAGRQRKLPRPHTGRARADRQLFPRRQRRSNGRGRLYVVRSECAERVWGVCATLRGAVARNSGSPIVRVLRFHRLSTRRKARETSITLDIRGRSWVHLAKAVAQRPTSASAGSMVERGPNKRSPFDAEDER